ncbi:hypothetical protein CLAFUW4_10680 [Fulvia fulva]|nr:hypothetical protein CLAFUR4_10685 [Fulvia fulva]WPV19611.1 hypothetical protein CLAFUW4_10680 [Fulvia fulva]WPV33883.1 hypothetical protein CLAFUW7_10682 [Fulvia fulva]
MSTHPGIPKMAAPYQYVKTASLPSSERNEVAMLNKQTRDDIETKIHALLDDRASLQREQRRNNDKEAQDSLVESVRKIRIGSEAQKREQRRADHQKHRKEAASKKAAERNDDLRAEAFAVVEGLLLKRRKQLEFFEKSESADLAKVKAAGGGDGPTCARNPTVESDDEDIRHEPSAGTMKGSKSRCQIM